jgi:hypothetical protein
MSVKRWNGTGWDTYAGAGVQGTTGSQGLTGTQGTQGTQGFGYAQLQGVQGLQGTSGSTYLQPTIGSTAIPSNTTVSTIAGLTLTSPVTNNPYLTSPKEKTTVSATAATGTIQFDLLTQGTLYYTTNASGNFTINFRGNSSTTLDSLMNVGDSWTAIFLNTNGSTPYYQSTAVTVDTSATVTAKWTGGTAPAAGNASAIDGYSYTIIKTATSTFTVLCGTVKFA